MCGLFQGFGLFHSFRGLARLTHRALVPVRAATVGPAMGPQQDPKPVETRDLSTREQYQVEVLKSSLQMRPVEARRMSWTLPTRQTYHKGACLCLTSLLQMTRTLANARRTNLPAKVTLTSWRGKTNSSVMGRRAYKSRTEVSMTMLTPGRGGLRTLTP